MFTYFHQKKFRYNEKGQLVPIFIVVLVVLIVMAMVTVNLSKIGLTKTNTSNAVDAGAIAGGSAMANLFNSLAASNAALEAGYWEFFASMSVLFMNTIVNLIDSNVSADAAAAAAASAGTNGVAALAAGSFALDNACSPPTACAAKAANADALKSITAAIGFMGIPKGVAGSKGPASGTALDAIASSIASMKSVITGIKSAMVAVTAFHVAQIYLYLMMRSVAEKGRKNAIKTAHKFAFMNSNLMNKLRSGSPPTTLEGAEDSNNYTEKYKDFFEAIGDDAIYIYQWTDGQARGHSVLTKVGIDPVDTFDLKVTVLPLPAELAILIAALDSAQSSLDSLVSAFESYTEAAKDYVIAQHGYAGAVGPLATACSCVPCCHVGHHTVCPCPCFWPACHAAEGALGVAVPANQGGNTATELGQVANAAGISAMSPIYALLPAAWLGLLPGFVLRNSIVSYIFSICWVDDIVHNRLVRVDTTQHHAGADLGLWQTDYPDTKSYSIVNFEGNGKIHPPVLRHDASIVETDSYQGVTYDICRDIEDRVEMLRDQITELRALATTTLDVQATELERQADILATATPARPAEADILRTQATNMRTEARLDRQDADTKEAEIAQIIAHYPSCNFGG